jgi:hypothetical protein
VKILVDTGQQKKKHDLKHECMEKLGAELQIVPLPVGDYVLVSGDVEDVLNRKKNRGIDVKKMDLLGSYKVSVDTKRDIQEAIGNICGPQHDRFRDEVILAQRNQIKLYILIENTDGVSTLDDLDTWENPRKKMKKRVSVADGGRKRVPVSQNATKGVSLAKAMRTMQEKYGVTFLFCKPEEAGAKILELLIVKR